MYYLGRMGWCDKLVTTLMKHNKLGALKQFIEDGNVFNKVLKISFMLDIAR